MVPTLMSPSGEQEEMLPVAAAAPGLVARWWQRQCKLVPVPWGTTALLPSKKDLLGLLEAPRGCDRVLCSASELGSCCLAAEEEVCLCLNRFSG